MPGTFPNAEQIFHILDITLVDENGPFPGAADFVSRFKTYQQRVPAMFHFADNADYEQALADLQRTGNPFTHIYGFRIAYNDLPRFPGFFYAPPCLYDVIVNGTLNPKRVGQQSVVMDFASERWIFREHLRKAIAPYLPAGQWTSLESAAGPWSALAITEDLADPLYIPKPLQLDEHEARPGTWGVVFDGRAVISDADAEMLDQHGICRSGKIRTADAVYPIHPTHFVVSGRVMQVLMHSKKSMTGACQYLPLLDHKHFLVNSNP